MQPKGREPGVYVGLSMQEYHDDPAIGGTDIKNILISEEKFWANNPLNPDKPVTDTNAFKIGRAYHEMVLEPEKPFPFMIKRGVQSSKVEGMIGEGDYNDLLKMYARLLKQPKHWNALHGGIAEASIFYRDEETGLMCKIRPDNFAPEWVGDLKTAKGISDKELFFDFPNNGYHISGYRYSRGMEALKKMIIDGYQMPPHFSADFIARFIAKEKQMFCFVFQDKNYPYSTRLWNMTPFASEEGYSYYYKGLCALHAFYTNEKYAAEAQPLAYPDVEDITEGMIYVQKKF